jgi:hypothetical protein
MVVANMLVAAAAGLSPGRRRSAAPQQVVVAFASGELTDIVVHKDALHLCWQCCCAVCCCWAESQQTVVVHSYKCHNRRSSCCLLCCAAVESAALFAADVLFTAHAFMHHVSTCHPVNMLLPLLSVAAAGVCAATQAAGKRIVESLSGKVSTHQKVGGENAAKHSQYSLSLAMEAPLLLHHNVLLRHIYVLPGALTVQTCCHVLIAADRLSLTAAAAAASRISL